MSVLSESSFSPLNLCSVGDEVRTPIEAISAAFVSGGTGGNLASSKRNDGEVNCSAYNKKPMWTLNTIANGMYKGQLIRYVPELANEDKRTVPDFLQRYCIKNLGSSIVEQLNRMSEIRSSWGLIASTASGHILSHIVRSCEIAIQCGAAPIHIFDGDYYEGTVICGSGYTLSLNGNIYHPLSGQNLTADLSLLQTHSVVLDKIVSILTAAGTEVEETPHTMCYLRTHTLKATLSEQERTNILGLAEQLRFPENRWAINVGRLVSFCDILSSIDNVDGSTPLGPQSLFSQDPVVVALSCFKDGSYPSFRHSAGTSISLETNTAPNSSIGQRRKGKLPKHATSNAAWIMTVRRVDFEEAVADFRLVQQEKAIRSVSGSTARQMGMFIASGERFNTIFSRLRTAARITSFGDSAAKRLHDSGSALSVQDTSEQAGHPIQKRRKIFW